MAAIPTEYEGTRFRSRLEATWAAVFDRIGWRGEWEYEPLDFPGYIPDFVLKWQARCFIEVKPALTLGDLVLGLEKAVSAGCDPILCLGATELKESRLGLCLGGNAQGAKAYFCFCESCVSATIVIESSLPTCLRCGARGCFTHINDVVRFCWREGKNKAQWRGAA